MVHGLETMKKLNDEAVSPVDAFEQGHVNGSRSPLSELQAAIRANEDYAWVWLCNLACIGTDSGVDHETANRCAAQFIQNTFGVDVRTQENWKRFESRWVKEAALSVVPPSFSAQCDTLLTNLQSVIDSSHKRTYEEMKTLADRLTAMSVSVEGMELGELSP